MCWERGLRWGEWQGAGLRRSAWQREKLPGVWGVCSGPGLFLLKVVLGKGLHILAPWGRRAGTWPGSRGAG